jgi:MarR family transcriptional regulator, 2-MHQ and catechol-resistance regulon repressor
VLEDAITRVPPHFEQEFPGASRSAAEVAATLASTATALEAAIERAPRQAASLSASAFRTLAILDGAQRALPSTVIAERLRVSTASMTSLLNTLEGRGLVERRPHPTNGRKILVHLTPRAQPIIDSQLPVIQAVITEAIGDVPEADRERLLRSLSLIKTRLAQSADQPLPKARAARRKPKRHL